MKNIKKAGSLALACLGAVLVAGGQQGPPPAIEKPNVIVIFTDDHGYADLLCQGQLNDLKTPNLDRLAADGMRCTSGYVTAPQCIPSRAGILSGRNIFKKGFRVDIQTDAALTFINRHKEEPFFLYLAYFAPHVPLEATEKYLKRFPGEMPERRRTALAMLAAIDDGVGRIREKLAHNGLTKRTLIFFISDNGAPLKIDMKDLPLSFKGGAWDGSRNDPWVGEKGMLSEGGIRVPFVVAWPGTIPAGKTYDKPVISLDVGATAVELAGLEKPAELDGVNIIPCLTGKYSKPPHDKLFWRFWNQSAIREGKWKYLQAGGGRKFLFNLESPEQEKKNLIAKHPEIAVKMAAELNVWDKQQKTPGVPSGSLNGQEIKWYDHYLPQ